MKSMSYLSSFPLPPKCWMKSTTLPPLPPSVEWRTAPSPSVPLSFVQVWLSVVISLVKSEVPLVNCLTNRKCGFITFLFDAATTLFTVSTFYWLTEFLCGHGDCCQTDSVCIDKIWELNCWVWNSVPPFFYSIFLTIFLRVFFGSWGSKVHCMQQFAIKSDVASLPLPIIMALVTQPTLQNYEHVL